MDDYISREEITNRLHVYAIAVDKTNTLSGVFRNIVRDTPAADVRPVVPARWIPRDIYHNEGNYKCSNCNQPCYVPECMGEPMYAFCPNCGADMREADHIANDGKKVDPCADCRWSPPSSFDGKPCTYCDTDDPLMNCYQKSEVSE